MAQTVSRNALVAVTQVLVVGAVLFLLYRHLLAEIGVAKLGIWSIVMAAVSVSKVAQLGFSGSTVKYVAKYLALKDREAVSRVIETATIATAAFLGIVALCSYPALQWLLKRFVPADGVADSLALLPYSLVALWLGAIGAVFQAGLDGCQRIDVRGYLMILAYIGYLGVAILLVDSIGLVGLAYAQVIQSVFLVAASWYALRRVMPFLPLYPRRWHRLEFREMLGYGMSFQFVSLMQMLYEPVTKLLIGNYGGLAVTGYYEMANRMVLQLRTLLVAGNQVLVPVIADAYEHDAKNAITIYHKSYRLMFFVAAPYFCLIIALVPFISRIWIGHFEPVFALASVMLSAAWWVNTLSAPAYFLALGAGLLRWLVVSYFVIAVLNVTLGYGLGALAGGVGPIIAWAIALAFGSLTIIFAHLRANSISMRGLLPRESLPLLAASVLVAGFSYRIYHQIDSIPIAFSITLLVFGIFVFPFVGLHPLGRAVKHYVLSKLNSAPTL